MATAFLMGQTGTSSANDPYSIVIGTSNQNGSGYTANDVDFMCNGTNDSAVLTEAFNSLPVDSGRPKKVVIKYGLYNLNSSITLDHRINNTVVYGEPDSALGGKPTLKVTSSGVNVFMLNDDSNEIKNYKFQNLILDGSENTLGFIGFQLGNSRNGQIVDCNISNFTVGILGNPKDCLFADNDFGESVDGGIYLSAYNQGQSSGNVIDGNTFNTPIVLSSDGTMVCNNTFNGNLQSMCIYVSGTDQQNVKNISILNNSLTNGYIYIVNCQDSVVSSNVVEQYTTGIELDNTVNSLIADNAITQISDNQHTAGNENYYRGNSGTIIRP